MTAPFFCISIALAQIYFHLPLICVKDFYIVNSKPFLIVELSSYGNIGAEMIVH